MQVLIAGGAGFIGVHLATRLLGQGWQVTVIDNLCTAGQSSGQHLAELPNCSLIKQDICEPLQFSEKFDLIMNLACPASPVDFKTKSLEILQVCSRGVRNLLDLAAKNDAVFLQASTSECYGDPLISPQNEQYWGNVNPVRPRSVYDEGKRFAEALTMAYHRRHKVPVRIARIFNTYGPNMRADDGRVVSNFIIQALLNQPLTVYGNGKQTRSFCYVDDMVEGLNQLAQADCPDPVNLGNPTEMTILQLAQQVIDLAGSSSQIQYQPLPQDDPKRRCPDITKARKLLGWEPKVDRPEGIAQTIEYFRSTLGPAASTACSGHQ